jgi:hypothetical protein
MIVLWPPVPLCFGQEYFTIFQMFFATGGQCDWLLHVLNAQHGLIGYIDEVMSVYRSGSSYFALAAKPLISIIVEQIMINEAFNAYFNFQYDNIFKARLARHYYSMAMGYLFLRNIKEAIWEMRQSIQKQWRIELLLRGLFIDGPVRYFRWALRKYAPGLYSWIKRVIHNDD